MGDKSNIVSWAGVVVGAAMFLFVIIRFHIYHHPYDYFRNSFEKSSLAFHSYSLYLFMVIGTGCFFPISILSSVPVQVPITMLLPLLYGLYVAVYRPYQARFENVMAALNVLAVCAVMGFRMYMEILVSKNVWLSVDVILYLLMSVVGLMVVVAVLGIVGTAYGYYDSLKSD
jgi:hypothetical protein